MQAQAVENTPKVSMMKYKNNSSIEEEEKEIERLEAERAGNTEEAEQEPEELNPEEGTFKKRYGDLRRHMQSKESQYAEEINKLKSQLESVTKQQVKLPKSDEELEQWAEKYPDVAKIVETIATKKAIEARKDVEEKLAAVDKMQHEVKVKEAESELARFHPDYSELRADADFHAWVDVQPKWIQDALYENETDFLAASKAIDLYKLETKPKPTTKDAAKSVGRPRRSQEPALETKAKWSESAVKKLSGKDYERFENEIMESIRTGNFEYDISGGAR